MDGQLTDEQLLNRFVQGHRDALGELARRFELPMLGMARGMLGGLPEPAMDAVQETWMRVIRFGHTFNGRSSVKTWLYRILINQCRNIDAKFTTDSRQKRQPSSAPEEDPTAALDNSEQCQSLRDAVALLNPAKRAVVLLCYHAGMTHEQASKILEIPLGTLKSRLNSALQELRASMSSEILA
ncbi:MAG: RNA polymerase sigma factor [Phycisphaerales bacterium]|nr:RNA polymerase sigma factor [Phycisphaerales bacterium]MCI0676620.1 RNA polymerase sigma factor [Phycisphaerales bacterium]